MLHNLHMMMSKTFETNLQLESFVMNEISAFKTKAIYNLHEMLN